MQCAAVNTISPLIALSLAAALPGCADVQERSHIVGGRTGTWGEWALIFTLHISSPTNGENGA